MSKKRKSKSEPPVKIPQLPGWFVDLDSGLFYRADGWFVHRYAGASWVCLKQSSIKAKYGLCQDGSIDQNRGLFKKFRKPIRAMRELDKVVPMNILTQLAHVADGDD